FADLILAHPDTKKRVDVFALSIYGLVIFPKALGHINDAVSDLFDWLDKRVTPVLAILAETFRSLSACWRAVFSENYSPLKEFMATLKRDNIFEEKWMEILQSLQDEDVELRAPWMIPVEILGKRVNDNISSSSQESTLPIEEHLQVISPELEIKLEAEKVRKGKNKAEEDLDSLKTYYKKLHLSMRAVGLGKTSKQWRQEIKEEKIRADQWEKKFQDAQSREDALERDLLESQNEKVRLRAQVAKLERSLHQYHSHNSAIELKVSLNKIEELKGKIEELEAWKEKFQCSQGQIRDRDHIMGKVATQ
ncbi:hypothetical protein Goarm_006542, partial [Gossypium armourianum]|nr:hypothetical protein [Gossypium armourianum]